MTYEDYCDVAASKKTQGVSNETKAKVVESLDLDSLAYLKHLSKCCKGGQFPENVQPSLIQREQKRGAGLRSSLLLDYGLVQRVEEGGCEISAIRILNAKGVAPTGVRNRVPWLRLARCCIFDGQRFVSNGHGVAVVTTKNGGYTWIFKEQMFFLRWPSNMSKSRKLYIELNTSHQLTEEEKKLIPKQDHRAFKLVDEVTTCWAMVDLENLVLPSGQKEMKLPLWMGRLSNPNSHVEVAKFHRRFLCGPTTPSITICIRAPLDGLPLPLSLLPPVSICLSEMAVMTCVYRLMMADKVADTASGEEIVCDPISAYLPRIVDDEDIFAHFLRLWNFLMLERSPTVEVHYREILEECTFLVAPLLNAQGIPNRRMGNDLEHRRNRQQMVERCLWTGQRSSRKPQTPCLLTEDSNDHKVNWLHKPFNVAEVMFHTS